MTDGTTLCRILKSPLTPPPISARLTGALDTACETYRWRSSPATNTCTLQFTPPVLFRYKLTNLHTNHRRCTQTAPASPTTPAARLQTQCSTTRSTRPCRPPTATSTPSPRGPSPGRTTAPPPMRRATLCRRHSGKRPSRRATNMPNLQDWEELHVWMRPAGLSRFSRLAKRNDADVLGAGLWQMNITSRFSTQGCNGRKALVLTTSSVVGGRGTQLGWAYVVSAVVCAVLGVGMTVGVMGAPRQLGDPAGLSWNRPDCHVVKDGGSGSLWERWVNYCHRNGFP